MLAGIFAIIEFVREMLLAAFATKIAGYTKPIRSLSVFNRITDGLLITAATILLTREQPQ